MTSATFDGAPTAPASSVAPDADRHAAVGFFPHQRAPDAAKGVAQAVLQGARADGVRRRSSPRTARVARGGPSWVVGRGGGRRRRHGGRRRRRRAAARTWRRRRRDGGAARRHQRRDRRVEVGRQPRRRRGREVVVVAVDEHVADDHRAGGRRCRASRWSGRRPRRGPPPPRARRQPVVAHGVGAGRRAGRRRCRGGPTRRTGRRCAGVGVSPSTSTLAASGANVSRVVVRPSSPRLVGLDAGPRLPSGR